MKLYICVCTHTHIHAHAPFCYTSLPLTVARQGCFLHLGRSLNRPMSCGSRERPRASTGLRIVNKELAGGRAALLTWKTVFEAWPPGLLEWNTRLRSHPPSRGASWAAQVSDGSLEDHPLNSKPLTRMLMLDSHNGRQGETVTLNSVGTLKMMSIFKIFEGWYKQMSIFKLMNCAKLKQYTNVFEFFLSIMNDASY